MDGIITAIGNHSFRGTGITNYLENACSLSEVQRMVSPCISQPATRTRERRVSMTAAIKRLPAARSNG